MTCEESVELFVEAHPEVADSPEAAAALAAARTIDDARNNSATSRSMMMGRFLDAMSALRLMAPDGEEESPLDEIRARRERRAASADRAASGG